MEGLLFLQMPDNPEILCFPEIANLDFGKTRKYLTALNSHQNNNNIQNTEQMILSGQEIKQRIGEDIRIEPFHESQVNPNSYNMRLHDELMIYENRELDMKTPNPAYKIQIPEEGLLLEPGKLYLGRTVEYTETDNLVPMLEGRSSIGRLGLFIHVTAGFGDVGFAGFWTLEIFCIQPIRIYAGIEICQIYYHTLQGKGERYDNGKYQRNTDIQASKLYEDFKQK